MVFLQSWKLKALKLSAKTLRTWESTATGPMATEEIKSSCVVTERHVEIPGNQSTDSLSTTEMDFPQGFNSQGPNTSNNGLESKGTESGTDFEPEARPSLCSTMSEQKQSIKFETWVHVVLFMLAFMFLSEQIEEKLLPNI